MKVSIGLAVFCLPWLRWKHPEWERPIKVNLIWPIIYVLATIFITIVPMIASPVETGRPKLYHYRFDCIVHLKINVEGIGIGIIATGIPVYFIFVYWKNKPRTIKMFSGNENKLVFLQQLTEV